MSYAQSGSVNNYFVPNIPLATTTAGVLREMDIGAASGNHGEMICVKACTLNMVGFMAVGEAASGTTTAPTVIFTKRPTPLSATGESVIGTVIVPSGTAVGAAIVKTDVAVNFAVGDSMEVSWTIGVGTPTGIGVWLAECSDHTELVGNVSGVTETA